MSGKAKPAESRRFSKGGKAGRRPGLGDRNLSDTGPNKAARPAKGWGQSKHRAHPKNPPHDPGK